MKHYSEISVAVTDGHYKHSLGIVRKLGELGVRPFVISSKKNSLAALSKYSNKEIVICGSFDIDKLIKVLLLKKIEVLILVGTNSFKNIVPWKKKLEENNIAIISVEENIQDVAFSKRKTYELAQIIGVPIPETVYPKCYAELEQIGEFIKYPCVIKGLYEVGGNIVDYASNVNELLHNYKIICNKYNLRTESEMPMIQEYIPGPGCAFFALYVNGECGPTFQHKRIREYPVTGGASSCAESYKSEILENYGRALLDALKWHGVAMVEFKLNKNGEPILMEINPKFWGSTDLALEAGVDFPKGLLDIYLGKKVEYSNVYIHPLRYHWPFVDDLNHVLDRPKSFLLFIRDILDINVRSNLKISDPMPTLYMILYFFWDIRKKLIRKFYV
jgi:carbamoylphosphate synthase large subunit